MRVRELAERLAECPPEAEVNVLIEGDPEFGTQPAVYGPPEVVETTGPTGTKVLIEPGEPE